MIKNNSMEWFRKNYEGLKEHIPFIKQYILGKDILDIGTEEGCSLLAMAPFGNSFSGMDPSIYLGWPSPLFYSLCETINEVCPVTGYPYSIGENDKRIRDLKTKFDVVTSFATFEHVANPKKAVEEIATWLLKPNGIFIMFSSPLYYSRRGGHLFHHLSKLGQWEHLRYPEYTLRKMYSDAGGLKNDNGYYWGLYKSLNKMTKNEFLSYVEPYFETLLLKVAEEKTEEYKQHKKLDNIPRDLLKTTGIKWIGRLLK